MSGLTDLQARKLSSLLKDQWWRINHLYWILDKDGATVRFKPNWAQRELYENMHNRNDVLKVRQLGISTFVAILILDTCLFGRNKTCGIIDKTLNDAKGKLGKIKFAFDHLDYIPADRSREDQAWAEIGRTIKEKFARSRFSATEARFTNGSSVLIGTSLRGGTMQILHISELAHVAIHDPKRAQEIVTGGINTVPKNGIVIKESTHEGGRFGLNYEMTSRAMEMIGKELTPLDWKFFFFSWIENSDYRLDGVAPPQDPELVKYFDDLASKEGILLNDAQKAWYAAQWRTFGSLTRQEYPTTPDEALNPIVLGSIYGAQIERLRSLGRLTAEFEVDDLLPLYVAFDIGMADYMSMWLIQPGADGLFYVIDHHSANNKSIDWYIARIKKWEARYAGVEALLLPHDASRRDWSGTNFEAYLQRAGYYCTIVPRTTDLWASIDATRRVLRHCVFHAQCSEVSVVDGAKFMSGVNALSNYQTAPPGTNGTERTQPLHNACSHASDAFRTFAEAFENGLISKQSSFVRKPNGTRGGIAKGVVW